MKKFQRVISDIAIRTNPLISTSVRLSSLWLHDYTGTAYSFIIIYMWGGKTPLKVYY